MDFEDILVEVGDRGKYQKKLILLFLLPTSSLLPWFTMNIIFMVSVPDHWCRVPEVVSSNLTIEMQRKLISPPSNPKCHMYNISYADYLSSGDFDVPNDTTTVPCRNGWEFDKTNYDTTVATQWNMYCEDEHYASLVLTLKTVGSMIGTPIYGELSDRIGRKIAFFIVLTITAISAFASVLTRDFITFLVIKTIHGSLMPCLFQIPFIIILEMVAPEMRTHMNGVVQIAWTLGACFVPLLAYLTRSWVILGFVTSSVTLLFYGYWKFLPESPRWLLSQEKYDEALVILRKVADENGKSIDNETLLSKLKICGDKIKKEKTVDNVQNSAMDLLRYPQLRKIFFIITVCWIADSMSYDGLQLNASRLAGNEFVNFFLALIVEIPGYITSWILLDKLGRRWYTAAFFTITGIVCILALFVLELPYAGLILSMIGKYCCSAAFLATYQQSSELYPTVVRSLGMGMSSTVAHVANLFLPYVVYLRIYGEAIPFVVIGTVCIIAGISATFLPETLNENLPQTISDAEEFGRRHRYFSLHRRRQSVCRERRASQQMKSMKAFTNNEDTKDENSKPM